VAARDTKHRRAPSASESPVFGDAVYGGLAVLVLADLQIGRLGGGGEIVALGVDQHESMGLAGDLTTQDEGRLCAYAGLVQRGTVFPLHREADTPDILRGLEQVARLEQVAARGRGVCRGPRSAPGHALLGGLIEVAADAVEDLLGGAQVSGGQQDEDPIRSGVKDMELAEGGDVVHAGISSRVGSQHQAFVEDQSDAVGHGVRLPTRVVQYPIVYTR